MKTLMFLLTAAISASSQAADYSFTRIVDTGGAFTGFVPAIGCAGGALNDSGAVAFVAQMSGGGYGIFRSDGSAAPVAIALGPSAPPSMNIYGLVAFVGTINGVNALFTGDGQTIKPVVTSDGPLAAFASPVINDTGGLAFAGFCDNSNREMLLRWGSGSLTTIAQEAPSFTLGAPACNNNGEVAFVSQQFDGGAAVLTGFGGRLAVIAAGPSGSIQGIPSIDDNGIVAFKQFDDPRWNIYTGDGGRPTLAFQSTDQLWIGSGDAIALNASGQIAFRGHATGDDHPGIYMVSGGVATKVIGQGDALDGSTATDVQLDNHGFNKHARIAFYATLADGRKGIYRSAPVCVGDVTTDQSVNTTDLLTIIAMWGNPNGSNGAADVNHDGAINAADLLVVISHWGACP